MISQKTQAVAEAQAQRDPIASSGLDLDITLSPRTVLAVLIATTVGLVAASIIGQLSVHFLGYFPLKARLTQVFFVDMEQSFPTAFASICLLGCAGLLAIIARATRRAGLRDGRYWTALSLLFLVLTADEYLSLHENDYYLQQLLGPAATGFLYFPWVIAGGIFVMAIGLAFSRFLLRLPPPTGRRFLAAALLFLAGAIGVEMIGAAEAESSGRTSLTFGLIAAMEELLEMLGVAVFLHALLCYVDDHLGGFALRIRSGRWS